MRQDGFTLVETLVALFVFAMLVTAGAFVLGNSAEAANGIEEATDELHDLQRTRAVLQADIGQMATRFRRDDGGNLRPPLTGAADASGAVMAFTRFGPDNPDGAPRPAMQYVEWLETPEGLVRRAFAHIDGDERGTDALLWPGAHDVGVAYNYSGAWSDRPRTNARDWKPRAVRLSATHPRFGRIEQVFLTGSAS